MGLENVDEAKKSQVESKRQAGETALGIMEQHLASRPYFVGEKFSLADVALYAYTHVCGQAGFDLSQWPSVKAWCERVAQQPGYVLIHDEVWA